MHTGQCMQELLEQVRRHKVNIDGDVCTVMVTTLVLEVKCIQHQQASCLVSDSSLRFSMIDYLWKVVVF